LTPGICRAHGSVVWTWLLRAAAVGLVVTAAVVAVLLPNRVISQPPERGTVCVERPESIACALERQRQPIQTVDARLPVRIGVVGVGAVGALVLLALSLSTVLEERRRETGSDGPILRGRSLVGR
jgi:hypothetical protein